jgi:hypothetical protein
MLSALSRGLTGRFSVLGEGKVLGTALGGLLLLSALFRGKTGVFLVLWWPEAEDVEMLEALWVSYLQMACVE